MSKCIICQKNEAGSEEHIIPDAIGGKEKTYCICAICNAKFGEKIDSEFVNNDLILTLRYKFQIKNRDRIVPNIVTKKDFLQGVSGEKIVLKKPSIASKPFYMSYNDINKSRITIKDEDKVIVYNESDIETIIDKEYKRIKSYKPLSREEVAQQLYKVLKMDVVNKSFYHHFSCQLNDYNYFALKIAFEYCVENLKDRFINTAAFENARILLYNRIYKNKIENIEFIFSSWEDSSKWSSRHFIELREELNSFEVIIKLFDAFNYRVIFNK